jgi:hypothetical protein
MTNKIWMKTYIITFLILLISAPSHAFYIKKVFVGPFKNPVGWNKSYNPGNIIAELFSQELTRLKGIQLVNKSVNMKGKMDNPSMMGNHASSLENNQIEPGNFYYGDMSDPEILFIQGSNQKMDTMKGMGKAIDMGIPWPMEMGMITQKASMTEVRGTVIKFQSDMRSEDSGRSKFQDSMKRENAVLQVHVELVQNKTGRVLFEKSFTSISKMGDRPFSVERLNFKNNDRGTEFSSMKYALDHLKREVGEFVSNKLELIFLEGEVIAINKNENRAPSGKKIITEEEFLVNLGTANGVRIGDLFEVNAVSLGLKDPFAGNDLGDIYVRAGVIQVLHVWNGFSKAMSLGGSNFKKGYLIRSIRPMRDGNIPSRAGKHMGEREIPWWEFHGIRAVN